MEPVNEGWENFQFNVDQKIGTKLDKVEKPAAKSRDKQRKKPATKGDGSRRELVRYEITEPVKTFEDLGE